MNADVTVREVMDREYVGVSESDDLVETAELLLREDADTAVVLRGSEPVGVLTCRDVIRLVVDGPDPQTASVADAMAESVPTVAPEWSLEEAADMMSSQDARRLVVRDAGGEGELRGIITEHDVLETRPLGRTRQERRAAATATADELSGNSVREREEAEWAVTFEEQSICEACGTLTSDLSAFNGQLLCADCRDM